MLSGFDVKYTTVTIMHCVAHIQTQDQVQYIASKLTSALHITYLVSLDCNDPISASAWVVVERHTHS